VCQNINNISEVSGIEGAQFAQSSGVLVKFERPKYSKYFQKSKPTSFYENSHLNKFPLIYSYGFFRIILIFF
jgi:hypothetical protein